MKLLLYCTKNKPHLLKDIENDMIFIGYHNYGSPEKHNSDTELGMNLEYEHQCERLNGKIVAECDYEVEKIFYKDGSLNQAELGILGFRTKTLYEENILSKSCLSYKQLNEYLRDSSPNGYAIHIKNLHIFDKPRELSEYYHLEDKYILSAVKQAPQNMMRVQGYSYDTYDVLISIRSKWLCKILNGEKTIEVRKKVLKGMLENEKYYPI